MSLDDKALEIAKGLVTPAYIDSGKEALRTDQRIIRSIIAQRRAPDDGISDPLIEQVLTTLALMDSNNFVGHVGAGEREGRVFSTLVAKRHFYMTHGIGRSGDLTADQPKAAGSSLMAQLTNAMATDFLRLSGAEKMETAIVVPMATGMSLSLVLSSLRASRPQAKYVIWPRIDQRTCLKCIGCAGFEAVVVPLQPALPPKSPKGATADSSGAPDDTPPTAEANATPFLQVPVASVEEAIRRVGPENVAAVLSTTSCFAPRLPDDVLGISRICKALDVPYIVNNAYGVQSPPIMKAINNAFVHGRLDAIVQSGDKNFLVPVGGSVVGGRKSVIRAVSELYAGRASAAPGTDLFITFLAMGRSGFSRLLATRLETLQYFHSEIRKVAAEFDETVFVDPRNDISFAMSLRNIRSPSEVGAVLFRHCVSGPRVIVPSSKPRIVAGLEFLSYGTHFDDSKEPLLVMACGIGMERAEVVGFVERLRAALSELKATPPAAEGT